MLMRKTIINSLFIFMSSRVRTETCTHVFSGDRSELWSAYERDFVHAVIVLHKFCVGARDERGMQFPLETIPREAFDLVAY